jgi:hypothetical protein
MDDLKEPSLTRASETMCLIGRGGSKRCQQEHLPLGGRPLLDWTCPGPGLGYLHDRVRQLRGRRYPRVAEPRGEAVKRDPRLAGDGHPWAGCARSASRIGRRQGATDLFLMVRRPFRSRKPSAAWETYLAGTGRWSASPPWNTAAMGWTIRDGR